MRFCLLSLVSCIALCADELPDHTTTAPSNTITPASVVEPPLIGPWLTGPLLAPSAHTIPFGHYNFEPYLFVNNNIGYLNNHWHLQKAYEVNANINFQFMAQMGLNSWMDLTIIPQFFYNYEESQSCWRFGDLYMGLGFQLTNEHPDKGIPSIKLSISEIFPTGMYQNLDGSKLGTDASGGGSFATNFKLVFSRLWNPYSIHYLAARLSTGYILFSQVKVNGVNAYGGDLTTTGRVVPGGAFPTILGFEYTFTKNWALALDIDSTYTFKTSFKGESIADVGNANWSYSLSFAPAIEYNYNVNVGLIAGVWVTAFGRNTTDFINYVIALNWYI